MDISRITLPDYYELVKERNQLLEKLMMAEEIIKELEDRIAKHERPKLINTENITAMEWENL